MIVKICGVKEKKTLICCEKNKVDFFGMIFYKKSPRYINISTAEKLQLYSKKLRINGVGVFVDFEIIKLKKFIKYLNLNFVQLHGEEDNSYINEVKKLGIKVIKKISIKNKKDLDNMNNFKNADYFLFDYKPDVTELPGGNAKSFDWNIIKNLEINKPWFLSGGININNIQQIGSNFNPYGIDLSSGVEKELGIKDNEIINNFMEKMKYA